MDKPEFSKIVIVLKSAYKWFSEMDELKMNVWFSCLGDLDYKETEKAIKLMIMTESKEPTIADIRKAVLKAKGSIMTAEESWLELNKNLVQFGWYKAKEGKEALSTLTAKAVETFGYKEMCKMNLDSYLRTQYIKAFNSISERESELQSLPENYRDLLKNTGNKLKIEK